MWIAHLAHRDLGQSPPVLHMAIQADPPILVQGEKESWPPVASHTLLPPRSIESLVTRATAFDVRVVTAQIPRCPESLRIAERTPSQPDDKQGRHGHDLWKYRCWKR